MEVPRHWRLRKQRYQLQGEVCNNCEAKIFPPRPVCPSCGEITTRKKPDEQTAISLRMPQNAEK